MHARGSTMCPLIPRFCGCQGWCIYGTRSGWDSPCQDGRAWWQWQKPQSLSSSLDHSSSPRSYRRLWGELWRDSTTNLWLKTTVTCCLLVLKVEVKNQGASRAIFANWLIEVSSRQPPSAVPGSNFPNLFFCLFVWESYYVTQVGLKLMILLPQPQECWDYRYVLPYPTKFPISIRTPVNRELGHTLMTLSELG
jgi:hypothetical protein